MLELPGRGHPPWSWYASNYPDRWDSYLKFTVVRNPWDRFVSAYIYARTKTSYWHNEQIGLHPNYTLLAEKSFEECCEIALNQREKLRHESWCPQHWWIAEEVNGRYRQMVDLVLRLERLDEDMELLWEQLGIPPMNLPHINSSKHDDYRSYYNERTASIIEDIYSVDIELLGYEF